MNLFIIFFSLISIVISKNSKPKCYGVLVHGKCHHAEVLTNGINRPYQLSYSIKSDNLYYSYNTGFQNTSSFKIGFINIKNHQKIPTPVNITNGFATAVDNKNNTVYYAGSEGIYKEKFFVLMNVSFYIPELIYTDDVWDLFHKHHLYYISYPSMRLYKLENEENREAVLQEHIHGKIYQFGMDKDDDIFITNKTGLFMIKNGTNEPILFKGATIFRAIEIDHNGKAYFCGQNELYVANKHRHELEKIADIENIFGLTFDQDNNIIFSDPHQIVRLTLFKTQT